MTGRWLRVRVGLCALGLAGFAAWVLARAADLQIVRAGSLRNLAGANSQKEMELAPQRGRILDRHGTELAQSTAFDSAFMNPRQLAGVPGAAEGIARALALDPDEVERLVAQKRYFGWLKRGLAPDEGARLLALKLPGVGLRKEPRRVYPFRELGATVLGHADVDGRGVEGVELAYDRHLRGRSERWSGLRDRLGRELLVEGVLDPAMAAGRDVVLSLDKYLTFVTEQALAGAVARHHAVAATSVMLDARTGEILAMASVPGYDPNQRDGAGKGARNRAVTDVFEPGSTMKTFTLAAAIDEGKVAPGDRFDCLMGSMQVGKHTIRDTHPAGILTAAEVLIQSSNIGAVKIARRIGKEALGGALSRFGFGRPTKVGLPGERSGTLRRAERWGEIEFANHAFGQGMTATPIQLGSAFAVLAAGGVYRAPRLGLHLVHPDGRIEPLGADAARAPTRVVSESTARTMLDIMTNVTRPGGTAKAAAIPGYPVAGKTGTAQKVSGGRYDPDKWVASFIGIVPADRPRLVILVAVDEPRPVHLGGVVAAPVFKEIAEAALRHLAIPPSDPVASREGMTAGERARSVGTAPPQPAAPAALAASEGPGSDLPPVDTSEPDVADDGVSSATAGAEGAPATESPAPAHAAGMVTVPDFTGMSLAEAVRAARHAGISVVPDGSGVAARQEPAPGRQAGQAVCRVFFRPGGERGQK